MIPTLARRFPPWNQALSLWGVPVNLNHDYSKLCIRLPTVDHWQTQRSFKSELEDDREEIHD